MNFLEIVLKGYFNDDHRRYLKRYFIREFKKAEKEHFDATEFFNGCLKVIDGWEKHLQEKVFKRKNELYLMLNEAKNGTLNYSDLQGKSIEERRKETIEYCNKELKDISKENYTVHLNSLTKGLVSYNMYYKEVLEIRFAILKAFEEIQLLKPIAVQEIKTHEKLYNALIFAANESEEQPIAGAYEILKEVWFFLNSDSATFNGNEIEKHKRPLCVNPIFLGNPKFDEFFEAEITYCSTQNKIVLKEQDFLTDLSNWIEKKSKDESLSIPRKRKFKEFLEYIKTRALPPQQSQKPNPELNEALISFSSTEIIESLNNELKGYFQGKEAELKRALQGKQLQEFLLFPHNQNKFVEVFKRLKYNGFLLSTPKEIKEWICLTFTYQYQKGNQKEVRQFNTSTVHDILTKDKGEPTKKERICIVDWLPYKSHLTRQREAEKENI